MNIVTQQYLDPAQQQQLMELWNHEYPVQLAHSDASAFRSYLGTLIRLRHYLLQDDQQEIKGWAFTFTREGNRWFAIILDRSVQGKGYGSSMLTALKKHEESLRGWVTDHTGYKKADGTLYTSPLSFYFKNNFEACPDVRLETPALSALMIRWEKQQEI